MLILYTSTSSPNSDLKIRTEVLDDMDTDVDIVDLGVQKKKKDV